MNIKIERKELLNALMVGASLAGRSKVLPILDSIKFRIKENYAQIISMDEQSAIQKRLAFIECDEQGEFAVNASDFIKAIKALKKQDVILSYNASDNTLVIKHDNGVINLSATTTEEFPVMQKRESGVTFKANSETLFKWLNACKSFVSTESVRPVMCGMYLEVKDGIITTCASDGTKMFVDTMECDDAIVEISAIVPSNVFSAVQSVINGSEYCIIEMDATHTTISTDDAKVSVRNIEGRFPNFRAVIPSNQTITVGLNKQEFSDALSRVSICSNATSLIRMNVDGMNVTIDADDADFGKSAKEDMMCEHTGDNITMGFKHDSMVGLINNISSSNVIIEMSTPSRAMIVKDNEYPNKVLLLMPCMLN